MALRKYPSRAIIGQFRSGANEWRMSYCHFAIWSEYKLGYGQAIPLCTDTLGSGAPLRPTIIQSQGIHIA